jgi:arylsulfatase A-like enzyme
MRLSQFQAALLLALLTGIACPAWGEQSRPPNILLIMADDLGYNDLHVYNGNPLAQTPHIDQLARDGVRFTRHYTDTVCAPSRAALSTGLFPARLAGRSGARGISLDVMTMADSLEAAGYRTHHVGKWHVRAEVRDAWPDRQGFASYFGFINQLLLDGKHVDGEHVYGRARYHDPWLSSNGQAARQYTGHLTDLLVQNTIDSIETFAGEQPWFINFWTLAPHFPSQPAPRWGQQYPNTREGQYLALVAQLDEGVGRILQSLANTGQKQNTIVIFTSDNGGLNLATDNNAPLFGRKSEYNEGGVRTPLIMAWPDHYPAGALVQQPVGIIDLFPTLARLAGAPVPDNLDGYDISPALSGQRLPPRAQFHERFQYGRFGFSVLSADGRWRMYVPEENIRFSLQEAPKEPVLYDLGEDPHGHHNVYENYPAVIAQLTAEYRDWHRHAREIRLTRREIAGAGTELKGDDLQRTPGYGGFTFAIAYSPTAPVDQVSATVAEQANAWSLVLDGGGEQARLAIGEYTLTAKLEPPDTCNSLMATAFFKISTLRPNPADNAMVMDLYQNGQRIGRHEVTGGVATIDDTSQPTTVGYSSSTTRRFSGALGSAIVLNSYTSPTTPVTIADLHRELCPGSN